MPKKKVKEKTLEGKETREEKLGEDEKRKKEKKALKAGKLEKPLDEALEEKTEEEIGKLVEAEDIIPEEEIVHEETAEEEAEKEKVEKEKIPDVTAGVEIAGQREGEFFLWKPKTKLGKLVASGVITNIDEVLNSGQKIIEPEILDKLVPNLKNELILIGGRKGKGGGIQRIPVNVTATMHRSGRKFTSNAFAVVGDEDGLIGLGKASALESRAAINKAIGKAKLNVVRIKRGCGSWECGCGTNHSIPYKTEGKSGSVRVILMPAPKGLGLVADDESKKLLRLAGIKDVWMKTYGNTRMRINLITALFKALKGLYVYDR
jgi:small subunit ribosomal protein S5